MSETDLDYLQYVIEEAPDSEVGPACMNVVVPPTIAMDEGFREVYCQGYRHALSDVRRLRAVQGGEGGE